MAAPLLPLAVFGLGPMEIIVIVALLVLIFGVRKIPELGKGLGQGIRNFRGEMKAMQDETPEVTAKSEDDKS